MGLRGASIELIEQARRFRKAQTTAEDLLWEVLRDRQLEGIKFRRQHPVERFIFDFYCPQGPAHHRIGWARARPATRA